MPLALGTLAAGALVPAVLSAALERRSPVPSLVVTGAEQWRAEPVHH